MVYAYSCVLTLFCSKDWRDWANMSKSSLCLAAGLEPMSEIKQ